LQATAKNYLPSIVCALTPILCYIVARPYAEIGVGDDWSYVKTAQVLVQTGHISYNGWEAAMLGWQLFWGALFIKLFGFSFTAVRLSTVIEGMAMAFIMQRAFVRAGMNSWNATLATMTFVLSPLCFPLVFTFMSDVPGVLCIVVCLYMCLRALRAKSERSAMAWICLAALLNAVGGTARQIAWLGVLVMVPSTLWLLRRSRRVLAVGVLSCTAGVGIVVAAMRWFARQPYTIPESLIPGKIDLRSLELLGIFGLSAIGNLALLALPLLLMFAGSLRTWSRRAATLFAAGCLCLAVLGVVLIHTRGGYKEVVSFVHVFIIFVFDYMTNSTFERLDTIAAQAIHFSIAGASLRVLLAAMVWVGILGIVTCLFAGGRGRKAPPEPVTAISWQKLGIVLGPFSIAYFVLLASIQLKAAVFDRYLMPLLALLLLVLGRYYQQRMKTNLPLACVLLIVVFGAFGIAATHDEFSLYRGYVTTIDEIRSAGAPATAILGPWEFEGWTQIEKVGYVNDSRIQVPQGAYVPRPASLFPASCHMLLAASPNAPSVHAEDRWEVNFLNLTPVIEPVYAILLDPRECDGQIAFAPVTYRTWVAPHVNSIDVVRLSPSFPQ